MSEAYLSEARQLLRYHPQTGNFYWLVSRGRQAAGSVAGTYSRGYIQIKVMEKVERANRLAWLFMTGEWPPEGLMVDHKNRVKSDNRWSNLRLATDPENSANQSVRPDNTSGYPGVGLFKRTGRWFAYIHYRPQPGGKLTKSTKVHLGYFATKAEAIAARKAAETQYFGAFAPQHGDPEMPVLRNKSAGPRIVHVVGGDPGSGRVIEKTLLPGEAAEVELLPGTENSPAWQAMMKSDFEEVGPEALKPQGTLDVAKALQLEQDAAEAVAKARQAREAITAAELDTNRMTVPRQFGSDGGPAQAPTVDNRGGALTQSQEEQGRQEPAITGSVPDTVTAGATPPPPPRGPGRPPKSP